MFQIDIKATVEINRPILSLGLYSNRHMTSLFAERLTQVSSYFSALSMQAIDPTALLIIEAHLTNLQAVLSPAFALQSILSSSQMSNLLSLTDRLLRKPRVNQRFSEKRSYCQQEPPLQTLLLNANKSGGPGVIGEVSRLAAQIYETLEEWEIIGRRAFQFYSLLDGSISSFSPKEDWEIRERVDFNIRKISYEKGKANESTEISVESEQEDEKVLQKASFSSSKQFQWSEPSLSDSLCSFLRYLWLWIKQVTQEILEFKTLLQLTKQESSVDQEQLQPLRNYKRSKVSLLTERIRWGHPDTPDFIDEFIQPNNLKKWPGFSFPGFIAEPDQMSVCSSKARTQFQPRARRLPPRQRKVRDKQTSCSKCEIY